MQESVRADHLRTVARRIPGAREVEIRADRPFDVYADGEPITSLPVTIKVIPGALRVIAPRPR